MHPPSVLWTGPKGIKNFQSRIFQDGILQNPGIPGFFRTGLALNFFPGILPKKSPVSLGVTISAHKFGQFYTFWTTYLFWKIHDETLPLLAFFGQGHLPHPVTSSKSERMFSVADNVVTPKRACLAPEYVEAEWLSDQGCISCGPCSYPELTEDRVLPSA